MGLKCTAVWLAQTELASNVRNSASNVQIGLKCIAVWLNGPQMYSCLIGSDRIGLKCTEFGLKCTENRPQMYRIRPQMYVHLRPICTFEADLIYFLMWSVWANQTAVHLRSQSDSCTFEADLYIWGQIPYIWGRFPYIWGRSDSTRAKGHQILGPVSLISWLIGPPRLGKGVRLAVKSARLARGSDSLGPGRVWSASNVRTFGANFSKADR